jgi:hypothetical protein
MSYPKPVFSVTLDGRDITSKIYPRLVSLTLTEERENAVDQLDITIDDSDGRVAIPAPVQNSLCVWAGRRQAWSIRALLLWMKWNTKVRRIPLFCAPVVRKWASQYVSKKSQFS